jgi:class 3 adenylate cyclase
VAALRRVVEGIATAQGGRVFNTAGDGFMLELGSSLAAVEAALRRYAQVLSSEIDLASISSHVFSRHL